MKNCSVCKAPLGLFIKKHRCLDGYICDDCFHQAKLPLNKRSSTSIEEIKKRIFNKANAQKQEQQNIFLRHEREAELTEEKKYTNIEGIIKIDFKNQKFKLENSNITYNFDQLISYEYVETEHMEQNLKSKSKKGSSITRSIVGGMIAGNTGAVVGAVSSPTTIVTDGIIKKIVDKMQIKLIIDPNSTIYNLNIISNSIAKSSFEYNQALDRAQKIMSYFCKIEEANKLQNQTESSAPQQETIDVSAFEQIKQYKELLDIGAITPEEFNAKKKQLLDL